MCEASKCKCECQCECEWVFVFVFGFGLECEGGDEGGLECESVFGVTLDAEA